MVGFSLRILFICSLFNNVNNSEYTASNDFMKTNMEISGRGRIQNTVLAFS
jgi:hypothetical protein